MGELLDHASAYRDLGLCLLPTNGKVAAVQWKRFQQTPSTSDQHDRWWSDDRFGMAILCGPTSGGLAVRDFDVLQSYEEWKSGHLALASSLPTARTARGMHVYFRCAEAAGKTSKHADGELRGLGGYVLAPPSLHPSGAKYFWLGGLPKRIPEIELADSGFENDTQEVKEDVTTPSVCHFSRTCSSVEEAICTNIPSGPGERHRAIFEFARTLKGMPDFREMPAGEFREIFEDWYKASLPMIRTKGFTPSWTDFKDAWKAIRRPAGEDSLSDAVNSIAGIQQPACAALYKKPAERRLITLCRELQRMRGDRPFFLGCRDAAKAVGMETKFKTVARWLNRLEAEGIIQTVKEHPRRKRWATEYRYLHPLD